MLPTEFVSCVMTPALALASSTLTQDRDNCVATAHTRHHTSTTGPTHHHHNNIHQQRSNLPTLQETSRIRI